MSLPNVSAIQFERRDVERPQQTVRRPNTLQSPQSRWIAACLSKRSGDSPDAEKIAEATIAVWQDIAAALSSIIGRQGVSALYERSLSLTARTHPWLAGLRAGGDNLVDLEALQSVLLRQSNSEAATGSSAFLRTFYDVLVSLIGHPLCERLLISLREDSDHADHEIHNL
jgi:hypothetical protein